MGCIGYWIHVRRWIVICLHIMVCVGYCLHVVGCDKTLVLLSRVQPYLKMVFCSNKDKPWPQQTLLLVVQWVLPYVIGCDRTWLLISENSASIWVACVKRLIHRDGKVENTYLKSKKWKGKDWLQPSYNRQYQLLNMKTWSW